MLKKILFTGYLLATTALPVQALPIWAELIARSQCEYMAMGVDLETAVAQSLRDNMHWFDEVQASPIASKTIAYASYELCPSLFQKASEEYLRKLETEQHQTKPANATYY